ncbi:MAG: M36 family metallopeptidase [Methylococcaceae bacterium]
MHKNSTTLALSISLLIAGTSSQASALPANYSALDNTTLDSTVPPPKNTALIDNSHPLQIDDSTKIPSFLWATPDSTNRAVRTASKISTPAVIEQAARKHLSGYASIYQLGAMAQAQAKLQHVHPIGDNGYIVRLGQQLNGIEVFAQHMNLLLDRSLQLTAISGSLVPQVTNAKALFNWSAAQAIEAAFHDLHQEDLPAKQLKLYKQQGVYQWYAMQTASPATVKHDLTKPVRIKKVFYPLAKGLEPAYYMELSTKSTAGGNDKANYAYVISAANGVLLSRSNMTRNDSNAIPFTYRVWADDATMIPYDSPYGDDALTPLMTPVTKPVSHIVSNLISLSCGPISTCDPWLPATATETIGNNVEAYADLTAPNGFSRGDMHAGQTTPYTFDYKYKFYQPDDLKHAKQLKASIVQAFYTTNFMHDWLYDHGFDELAGNGQNSNYKRGGKGGDRMHVEVNDYSGTDNANMTTPVDGASATMQLYPWTHDETKKLVVVVNDNKIRYTVTSADFGPSHFFLTGKKIVLLDDGVTTTSTGGIGSASDGCQTPIVNAADLVGAIALIDRGDCKFVDKAKNAQNAGAIAVLIANNVDGAMTQLGGNDNTIHIPVLGIDQYVGLAIKLAMLKTTVVATMAQRQAQPYNGALDSTIVIHEWGHFLSQRLVTLDNNQGSSMGEGWSDFLALLAMVREQDRSIAGNEQFQAPYAIGQYVSSIQPASYSFGIRRYPYSTDFSKNPLTFKHISDGVALPRNVPVAPGTNMKGNGNSEVHNSGEVWGLMLWEAYTALLNDTSRLSFSEAQNRMLDYLVASLKMTPVNPTFLEARDALLAVAKTRDLVDYELFQQAFAKRGAGIGAKAPRKYSKDHAGVVEDFTTP